MPRNVIKRETLNRALARQGPHKLNIESASHSRNADARPCRCAHPQAHRRHRFDAGGDRNIPRDRGEAAAMNVTGNALKMRLELAEHLVPI